MKNRIIPLLLAAVLVAVCASSLFITDASARTYNTDVWSGRIFPAQTASGVVSSDLMSADGVNVLPWMLCGTNSIGEATAAKMKEFRLVVWGMHGIYGVGKNLDEAFGLIETVEKAAQIYMLTANMPRINTIKDSEMVELAEYFGVDYRKDFLNL